MFLSIRTKLLWFIVIWFAVMQTISPLMHGHLETDNSVQSNGMHMHITNFEQNNDKIPTFKNADSSLHTIGVDNALVKDFELVASPVFAFLFFLLAIAFISQYCKVKSNKLTLHPFFLRPNSSPRAPPLY